MHHDTKFQIAALKCSGCQIGAPYVGCFPIHCHDLEMREGCPYRSIQYGKPLGITVFIYRTVKCIDRPLLSFSSYRPHYLDCHLP